ncbi:hypothetical protein [Sporomusa termitida]|uniref:Uncharacterized protein n=1 Tax=Sporomusa termitida TaxID=2377 RepID=A0A517DSA0_9FIRM|nr:hypothetical protein [Sporomusa termitida]QDR80241.1 hypothetical protein SPTER_15600 [Sporomusa termitida]
MSGVKKALFGSKDKVKSVSAQVYPETDYQKAMREQLTGTATGLLGSASGLIGQGTDLMSQTASGQLNSEVASNLQSQAMDNYSKQVGSLVNNMALKNLGANSMTQNALAQAGTDANNWIMNNYMTALQNQASNAQGLYGMGYQNMAPATGLYSDWLGFQQALSSPAQTVVQKGNTGLLGSAMQAYATYAGAKG